MAAEARRRGRADSPRQLSHPRVALGSNFETERKYKAYVSEHATKKTEFDAAAKELEKMRETALKEGILTD